MKQVDIIARLMDREDSLREVLAETQEELKSTQDRLMDISDRRARESEERDSQYRRIRFLESLIFNRDDYDNLTDDSGEKVHEWLEKAKEMLKDELPFPDVLE